jgi:hypothetical protein
VWLMLAPLFTLFTSDLLGQVLPRPGTRQLNLNLYCRSATHRSMRWHSARTESGGHRAAMISRPRFGIWLREASSGQFNLEDESPLSPSAPTQSFLRRLTDPAIEKPQAQLLLQKSRTGGLYRLHVARMGLEHIQFF